MRRGFATDKYSTFCEQKIPISRICRSSEVSIGLCLIFSNLKSTYAPWVKNAPQVSMPPITWPTISAEPMKGADWWRNIPVKFVQLRRATLSPDSSIPRCSSNPRSPRALPHLFPNFLAHPLHLPHAFLLSAPSSSSPIPPSLQLCPLPSLLLPPSSPCC